MARFDAPNAELTLLTTNCFSPSLPFMNLSISSETTKKGFPGPWFFLRSRTSMHWKYSSEQYISVD
jgi:hypothetical protein